VHPCFIPGGVGRGGFGGDGVVVEVSFADPTLVLVDGPVRKYSYNNVDTRSNIEHLLASPAHHY
jgi:hypothetical protein